MERTGMNKEGTVNLFHYWNSLRGSRPAPRRSEIEPADIKAFLPDTFILECDARREPVFRLAGTRLCTIYGKELKGHSFPSLWNKADQETVSRLVRLVLDDKSVAVATFEGVSHEERVNRFELIVLPLEGGDRESARAIGTVQPLMKPFWLGADPIVENRVEGFRLLDPDHEQLSLQHRTAVCVPPLLPDGDAVSGGLGDRGRRIHHLVVFQGGRA